MAQQGAATTNLRPSRQANPKNQNRANRRTATVAAVATVSSTRRPQCRASPHPPSAFREPRQITKTRRHPSSRRAASHLILGAWAVRARRKNVDDRRRRRSAGRESLPCVRVSDLLQAGSPIEVRVARAANRCVDFL